MLAKSMKVLLLCGAGWLLSGCGTPCGGPGDRLCPPVLTLTSAPPPKPPPAAAPAPAPAASETYAIATPRTTLEPAVGAPSAAPGFAAPMPSSAPAPDRPLRIALLLPLHSDTLGAAAEALRAGFMAAYQRERANTVVNLVDSGDASADVLAVYTAALAQNDIVVGPLTRAAVGAVAASGLVSKPTLALNHPDPHGAPAELPLPPQMLAIGLSIEDEARQAARWAGAGQPDARALIVAADLSWQQRIAAAFAAQWKSMGLVAHNADLTTLNGYLSEGELSQLRARMQSNPPTLLFAALDADQLRQLRGALGSAIPIYGTSSLNPGDEAGGSPGPELDGVRLLDLPWQVQRDDPAVLTYPRPAQDGARRLSGDLQRLYALGIDAFRVARAVALRPGAPFAIDGVTGQLSGGFGPAPAGFERAEQKAVYQNGALVALPAPR